MKRFIFQAVFLLLVAAIAARADTDGLLSFTPRISPADFDEFMRAVTFEKAEDEAMILALYERWAETFSAQGAAAQAKYTAADDARKAYELEHEGASAWTSEGYDFGLNDITYGWRMERCSLEWQLDKDILSALKTDQQSTWARLTRRVRRRELLPEVRLSFRRYIVLDLIAIVEGMPLTADESLAVEEVLDDYAANLDDALRQWEGRVYALRARIMSTARELHINDDARRREEINRVHEQIDRLAHAISDINATYADLIASCLSEENAQQLLREIDCIRFPDLCAPSPVDLVVECLLALERLDDNQVQQIEALYSEYRPQRDRIRRELLRAVRRWNDPSPAEQAERQRRWEQMRREGGEGREAFTDHPALPWLARRRALAKTTCAEIRAVMTAEQFDSLPIAVRMLLSW